MKSLLLLSVIIQIFVIGQEETSFANSILKFPTELCVMSPLKIVFIPNPAIANQLSISAFGIYGIRQPHGALSIERLIRSSTNNNPSGRYMFPCRLFNRGETVIKSTPPDIAINVGNYGGYFSMVFHSVCAPAYRKTTTFHSSFYIPDYFHKNIWTFYHGEGVFSHFSGFISGISRLLCSIGSIFGGSQCFAQENSLNGHSYKLQKSQQSEIARIFGNLLIDDEILIFRGLCIRFTSSTSEALSLSQCDGAFAVPKRISS